jgi:hypothetical protein
MMKMQLPISPGIFASVDRYYNELEFKEIPANYFKEEAEFLFKVFTENFDLEINEQYPQHNPGLDRFFKNHLPVDRFEKINPLDEELIQQAYSLVDYNDGKYFLPLVKRITSYLTGSRAAFAVAGEAI